MIDLVRSYNLELISNLCDYPIGMFLFAIHTCCKSQNLVQWIYWRVFLSVSDQHNDASRLWICDWFWNWFSSDQKNASTTVKIASKISLGLFTLNVYMAPLPPAVFRERAAMAGAGARSPARPDSRAIDNLSQNGKFEEPKHHRTDTGSSWGPRCCKGCE